MHFVGVDTALVNTGLVILDGAGEVVYSGKPYPKKGYHGDPDSFFWQHRRIRETADWILGTVMEEVVKATRSGGDKPLRDLVFIAFEDYLMTKFASAYKTAELVALLKDWCHGMKVPYCLVHPMKTKKYVVKQKKVSKTEMIAHCKKVAPKVLEGHDRADHGDLADAYAIAKVGMLVYNAMVSTDPESYVRAQTLWPDRWKEILLGQSKPTGIITKPGLCQWSYE